MPKMTRTRKKRTKVESLEATVCLDARALSSVRVRRMVITKRATKVVCSEAEVRWVARALSLARLKTTMVMAEKVEKAQTINPVAVVKATRVLVSWVAFSEVIKAAKVFSDIVDYLVQSNMMLVKA